MEVFESGLELFGRGKHISGFLNEHKLNKYAQANLQSLGAIEPPKSIMVRGDE